MPDTLAALLGAHFPDFTTDECRCGAKVASEDEWAAHVADEIRRARGGATAHAGGGPLPGSVGCVLAHWNGADWEVPAQTPVAPAVAEAAARRERENGAHVSPFAMYELALPEPEPEVPAPPIPLVPGTDAIEEPADHE
jgi:hypothetical protein